MWTHAPVEQLLPGLRRIADTLPAAPSHMLWMNWGPAPTAAVARPTWPTASRTTPTSPSTGRAGPAEDDADVAWVDRADARDGAAGERHPAGRREPRPPPGAVRRATSSCAAWTSSGRGMTLTGCFPWMGRLSGPPRGARAAERGPTQPLSGAAARRPPARRCWRRSRGDRATPPARSGSREFGRCSTLRRWRWRRAGGMLADGVGQVAARTPMPGVGPEMVDWWFDWHPREAIRYRIWHPAGALRQLAPGARPRRAPSPIGGRCTIPSRTSAWGSCMPASRSRTPSPHGLPGDALGGGARRDECWRPRSATIAGACATR